MSWNASVVACGTPVVLRLAFVLCVAAVTAALLLSPAVQAEPVQWQGNGHWYERIDVPVESFPPSWHEARDAAAGTVFRARTGHLATITSQGEQDFIAERFMQRTDWAWIGAAIDGSITPFRWITGEPVNFTAWNNGFPSDNLPTFVVMHGFFHMGRWETVGGGAGIHHYIVEYSEAPVIVASDPPHGFIDPRNEVGGIEQVTLTFEMSVTNLDGLRLDESAFTVTATDNPALPGPPQVPEGWTVEVSNESRTAVVTLTHAIPVGEWTTITANVVGLTGEATLSVTIGHLPCDANQDGHTNISDVGAYGMAWRRVPQPMVIVDHNRSGIVTSSDPGAFGASFNGFLGSRQWNGIALPERPPPTE